jgi:hypothetical protein
VTLASIVSDKSPEPASISIRRFTLNDHVGYLVGRGLHGTTVFVRSALAARTIRQVLREEAHGELSRNEAYDVVSAILADDKMFALRADAKAREARS